MALPQCATAPVDYLIVVTSRQLNAGFGDNFKQMFGEDVFTRLNPEVPGSAPTDGQMSRLPPRHMFVLSIEEFDQLVSGVRSGDVDLLALLREVTHAISQRGGVRMFFHQVLEGRYKSDWPKSRLIAETRERVMADVVGHLQAQEARQGKALDG